MPGLKKIMITTFQIALWLGWHYPFVHKKFFLLPGTFFFKKKSFPVDRQRKPLAQ
jgi:hypothetical protein